MLNIAMLSYHTCPLAVLGGKDTGGMNVYVRELTRHLGALGVHVDVFTRSQDEHVPHVLHDLGYGNRVVHVPAGPEVPLPRPELAAYLPQYAAGIAAFARDKHLPYDLVHSHYWMSGVAAGQLKAAWGVPVAHMFHTLGLMKNRIARDASEMEGAYRIEGERSVLRIVDKVVAATAAEQAQLEFLYGVEKNKIAVVPPGVDTGHFYPIPADEAKEVLGIAAGERMVLFVGRIEPLKGLETLIRAISILRSHGDLNDLPFHLAVIGGDPDASPAAMNAEMARLLQLSRELGLQNLVLFLGKRGQDSLPYYYSAAEVVVMPSHYESFGMVALEAMACGTPVVASQVGGLAFLVQDGKTGYVVPDNEPQALAERLARLLCQPDLRRQLGQQAADYARGYAWQLIAGRIAQLYEDMLGAGGRAGQAGPPDEDCG